MASILRIPVLWTGSVGLPGVSVFYSSDGDTSAVADLVTFFTAIEDLIPDSTSVTVPSSGDSIDDATGGLDGTWSGGSGGTIGGDATGDWFAGVGAAVQWNTAGIRNGRRVRGRTFLAPLAVIVAADNGTLDTLHLATIQTAASALAAAGMLVTWSRPSTPGGSDGESNQILSATVPDRVTSLRSRRY